VPTSEEHLARIVELLERHLVVPGPPPGPRPDAGIPDETPEDRARAAELAGG